jgi:L-asparagine oxygenase
MSDCHLAAAELPQRIHCWGRHVKEMNVGLIRNLPIDADLPATPTTRHSADEISMLADRVMGIISALFGTIYTIEGKGTGRHIHNMYPVIGDEYTQLGSSSMIDLDWHVEEAFHPARPTWLSLLCIRGDIAATTKVARVLDLQLQEDARRTLQQPRFKLRIDETYNEKILPKFVTTCVLTGPVTDEEIILDPAYTIIEDDVEASALAAIGSAAEQAHQRFTLTAGDQLVFNNRRVIHGRSAYLPRMDGTDRWLKRAFILESPEWLSRLSNGVIPFELY